MALKILTGEVTNVLALGESVTGSPAANSLFPLVNVYDGRIDSATRFSAASTTTYVQVDGQRLANGDFDNWSGGLPVSYTVDGTATQSTDAVSGSALRVNGIGGAGQSNVYQDVRVRSGQQLHYQGYYHTGATSGDPFVYLQAQNLQTGRHWTGSSWGEASDAYFQTGVGTLTYTSVEGTMTVEPYSVVGKDETTIRFVFSNLGIASSDYVFYDDFAVWPLVDTVAVFGHNVQNSNTVTLRSSVDAFASTSGETTRATLTVQQPSFYGALSSAVSARYWRLQIDSGTVLPSESIWLGEVVLDEFTELTRERDLGTELRTTFDNIRVATPFGSTWSHRMGRQPRRVLGASFSYFTSSEYQEARQEVFERSFGSANPVVVIPDDAQADVIHGRINDDLSVRNTLASHYDDGALIVVEDAYPVWTA